MKSALALSDSALGDLVSSSVVIKALAESHAVDLVTRPELSEFAAFLPGVHAVTWDQAVAREYNLIVDLTSSSSTRARVGQIKSPRKLGRADGAWGWLKARATYDRVVAKTPVDQIVRDYDPLLRELGRPVNLTPTLNIPAAIHLPAELARVRESVVVHVGAGNPLRVLPEALIREIVTDARNLHKQIIFIGTEQDVARRLTAQLDHYPIYAPLTLTQLARVLREAEVVIAPDSGPLHLAAAVGANAIGIYGPNLSRRAGPIGSRVRFVEKDFSCRPCNQNRACPFELRCLRTIRFADLGLNFASPKLG